MLFKKELFKTPTDRPNFSEISLQDTVNFLWSSAMIICIGHIVSDRHGVLENEFENVFLFPCIDHIF